MKIKFSNKSVLYRFYSTNSEPLKYNVPSLKQTLEKYTRYLQPLISERELQKSKLVCYLTLLMIISEIHILAN